MPNTRSARFFPSAGFLALAITGLLMAMLAVACRTPAQSDPEQPQENQIDPAQAEKVEPTRPMGDGDGGPPASEPGERPEPVPGPEPLPDPNPVPTPDPAPQPAPSQPRT
ncbi:MAG TPA: hypothetical protein VNO33_15390 [Kofleriaceae bacterium]|nr:hypothetical protein [Kofleriaceae bacterium]